MGFLPMSKITHFGLPEGSWLRWASISLMLLLPFCFLFVAIAIIVGVLLMVVLVLFVFSMFPYDLVSFFWTVHQNTLVIATDSKDLRDLTWICIHSYGGTPQCPGRFRIEKLEQSHRSTTTATHDFGSKLWGSCEAGVPRLSLPSPCILVGEPMENSRALGIFGPIT